MPVELKTIYKDPLRSSGVIPLYSAACSEITGAMKKYRTMPDVLNVIALVNFPGRFADIGSAYGMLGQGDRNAMSETFLRRG